MKLIRNHIYYENKYSGATVGAVLFSAGTLLVDSPLKPEDARAWLASLGKTGSQLPRLIINLDSHPDRTLGTETLKAPVIAHQETARQFRRRAPIFKALKQESGAEWEETSGLSGLRLILPQVTFSERLLFHLDHRELRLEPHGGVCPGACWLVLPADKVIFVGDTVVQNQPPFLAQADIEEWVKSLDLLLSRPFRDYTIICGRGGKASLKDISAQKRFLNEVQSRLKRIAKRNNTAQTEVDKLALKFAQRFKVSTKRHHLYVQRLKYGLHHYYSSRFWPGRSLNND